MKMKIRAYENMLFNSLWKQTNIICLTTKYVNITNYFKLELLNKMSEITLTKIMSNNTLVREINSKYLEA